MGLQQIQLNIKNLKSFHDKPNVKPVLKWAGGKTQLLGELIPRIPNEYQKYIEPFFGGGALFFALMPKKAIIGDSNPELINLYKTIAKDVKSVICFLKTYVNEEKFYYSIRSEEWRDLSPDEAAARTIYLNRTCYNGLYRVNKQGNFNVPYGRYKNPRICDETNLKAAAKALNNATIIEGDYKDILRNYSEEKDFVYLDPPYLPISKYSDFKRYTKEQFRENDHSDLATEVLRLHELGCFTILTNSNHHLVQKLYQGFKIEVFKTKRNINRRAEKRTGEDVIITIPPRKQLTIRELPKPLNNQVGKYPPSRFMGSKQKILKHIWEIAKQFDFETVLDLFSGSGSVGYMFKSYKKQVFANDYMAMAATFAIAMIENNSFCLDKKEVERLLRPNPKADKFVSETFKGLYYTDEENQIIDSIRANIKNLKNRYKRAIAMSSLIRACIKKRPRGIFTYTGFRYDDGRRDLRISIENQFREAVSLINNAVFDNKKENTARRGNALTVKWSPDLVYIDPPYYSLLSDNEYVRRYHFVEGLARYWKGVTTQQHTKTKKFKSYPTPFSSRSGTHKAFDKLFRKYKDSVLIISYSSNSLPTSEEIISLIAKYKNKVEVVSINHRYSFGNQGHKVGNNNNGVQEYLFVGY